MKPFDVPPLFATWTALACLAAAAERKVWHVTNKGQLFPNIYALLIGPAASGKTVAIHEGRRLLQEIETIHIAAANVSRASFVDELNDAQRRVMLPKMEGLLSFNSLTCMINEFGVFLPTFDTDFMAVLTDLWDGKGFSERKRKLKDKIDIPKSTVTLIGGWTPSALAQLLPEGAWEQGFMSRMTLVYSGGGGPQNLWDFDQNETKRFSDLVHDLKIIHDLHGPLVLAKEALDALLGWHMRAGPPRPDHPKLHTYTLRRTALLIKLCMLVSIGCSSDRIIELEHYQHALRILLDTEALMPDAFKAMQTGGDMNVIKEVYYIVLQEYMRKNNKAVPIRLVLQLIAERTPAHNVARIYEVMKAAEYFKEENNINTGKVVVPRGKRPGDDRT